MTDTVILAKVQKLLRLATSSNANEAALAAAKAQELIDKHQLAAALLALDSAEPANGLDDEPIVDFEKAGAPLESQKKLDRWRGQLASVIARQNGCRIYYHGSDIALVGRPSDAETVRYLYGYLSREVERLATENGRGMGRTWRNNFRLGVVDAISAKLYEQRRKFESETRAEARAESGTALMRIDRALAKIDKRGESVAAWIESNLKLYSRGGGGGNYNHGARQAGRKAGQSVSIGGARGSLTSAAKGLPA